MLEINTLDDDRFELLKGESSYQDKLGNEIVILKREGNIITWAIFKPEGYPCQLIRKSLIKSEILLNGGIYQYFTDELEKPHNIYDLDNFKPITS